MIIEFLFNDIKDKCKIYHEEIIETKDRFFGDVFTATHTEYLEKTY